MGLVGDGGEVALPLPCFAFLCLSLVCFLSVGRSGEGGSSSSKCEEWRLGCGPLFLSLSLSLSLSNFERGTIGARGVRNGRQKES